MPKTRNEKQTKVDELSELLGAATAVYLADLTGMKVSVLTEFRRTCRENGIRIEVVKNTLLTRAARDTNYEAISPHLNGPTAILTVDSKDTIAPARILDTFTKKTKGMPKVKAACFEGDVYDEAAVQSLALLPTREVLLSQFLSVLQAPLTKLVMVLNANPRNLANVLDQIAKQKGGEPAQ